MHTIIHRLLKEEDAAIVSAEVMLIATLLVIGMIVGLKSVRDSVTTELADVAEAFDGMGQQQRGDNDWDSGWDDDWGGGSKCINIGASAQWEG